MELQQQQQSTEPGQQANSQTQAPVTEAIPDGDEHQQKAREAAIKAVEEAEAKEAARQQDEAQRAKPDKTVSEPEKTSEDDGRYTQLVESYARLEKRLHEVSKEVKPLRQKASEAEQLIERLKDPKQRYQAFEELGGDYREWTDRVVNDPEAAKTPEQKDMDALKAQVAELTSAIKEQAEERKKLTEEETRKRQATQAAEYVAKDERFAFTHALKQSDALLYKYQQMVDAGQTPESDEQVALAFEKDLTERLKQDLQALSAVPRFRELAKELGYVYTEQNPKQTAQAQQAKDQGNKPQNAETLKPASSLTNDLSAEPGGGFDYSKASAAEKRKRAVERAEQADRNQKELLGLA